MGQLAPQKLPHKLGPWSGSQLEHPMSHSYLAYQPCPQQPMRRAGCTRAMGLCGAQGPGPQGCHSGSDQGSSLQGPPPLPGAVSAQILVPASPAALPSGDTYSARGRWVTGSWSVPASPRAGTAAFAGVLHCLDLLPARKKVGAICWAVGSAAQDPDRETAGETEGQGGRREPAGSSPVLADVLEGRGAAAGKHTQEAFCSAHVLVSHGAEACRPPCPESPAGTTHHP